MGQHLYTAPSQRQTILYRQDKILETVEELQRIAQHVHADLSTRLKANAFKTQASGGRRPRLKKESDVALEALHVYHADLGGIAA